MNSGQANSRRATNGRRTKGITAGKQGKACQLFRLGAVLLFSLWGECIAQSQSFGPSLASPISWECEGEEPSQRKNDIFVKREASCDGMERQGPEREHFQRPRYSGIPREVASVDLMCPLHKYVICTVENCRCTLDGYKPRSYHIQASCLEWQVGNSQRVAQSKRKCGTLK